MSKDRKMELQQDFENTLSPCKSCDISEICKYTGSLKRFDFNPDVFEVSIDCKLKTKYTLAKKED